MTHKEDHELPLWLSTIMKKVDHKLPIGGALIGDFGGEPQGLLKIRKYILATLW